MDIEEPIPSDIQITQYFTLFISEFLFTFICGFCDFDSEKNNFITHFKNFDTFCVFVLEFLTSKFTNVLSIFEFAQKKISFMQTDCEKTEYTLTDRFNAYGVYYITLLAFDLSNFSKNFDAFLDNKDIVKYLGDNKIFFYPKIFSKEFNSSIILEILRSLISIENHFEQKGHLNVFYAKFVEKFINIVIEFYKGEIKFLDFTTKNKISSECKIEKEKCEIISNSYSKCFSKFILDYLHIKAEERNEKLLISFSSLYEVMDI
jgi:hypothetical protein